MRLLSFLKRTSPAKAAKPAAVQPVFGDESVERVRTRSRHRLIGAVVLLGVAVIGFPLLFETQPRPIPVDLPIHIPKQEAVAPLNLPARSAADSPAPNLARAAEPEAATPLTESAEEAGLGRDVPEPVSPPLARERREPRVEREAAVTTPPAAAPLSRPEVQVEPKSAPVTAARNPAPDAGQQEARPASRTSEADARRVQALLEGRTPPPAPRPEAARSSEAGRFVLQVGAYSEGSSAREARQKVDRLGLRTYTQEVETADGRRIRVRVGPFTSREEADQAAARLRSVGLPVALLPQ